MINRPTPTEADLAMPGRSAGRLAKEKTRQEAAKAESEKK